MTAPTPQEAVTDWIIIGTALCFAFALACIASDHMLPWIESWWHQSFKWHQSFSKSLADSPEHRAQVDISRPQYETVSRGPFEPPELRALPAETDEDGLPL